jgi:hypothetical protein
MPKNDQTTKEEREPPGISPEVRTGLDELRNTLDTIADETHQKKDEKPRKSPLDVSVVAALSAQEITSDLVDMLAECPDSYGRTAAKVLRSMKAPEFVEIPENRYRDLVRVGRVINAHVPPPPQPLAPCWHDVRELMKAALRPYLD